VNRVVTFDIDLVVSALPETIVVAASVPQLDAGVSSSGITILPQQIEQMPLNDRNYLDLMQLVPGIAVNRRVDAGTDAATPVLGERGGNRPATWSMAGLLPHLPRIRSANSRFLPQVTKPSSGADLEGSSTS